MNALEFLMKLAKDDGRIVSTGDLHEMQISEARVNDRMFVDEETGLGFVILPWALTTDKDKERELALRRSQYDCATADEPTA